VTNATVDIVFVHGSPGGAGVWRSQFAEPFPGANLIAYDRPGYGVSQPLSRHPHLQEQADALVALIAIATTNRVFVVGHSYGGPVALLAAIQQSR